MSTKTEVAEVFAPTAPRVAQPVLPWIVGAGAAVVVAVGVWTGVNVVDTEESIDASTASVQLDPANRATDAQTARLEGLAATYGAGVTGLAQAQQAAADRWTGLASQFATVAGIASLNPAQQAEADRLTGLASQFTAVESAAAITPELVRGVQAEAARLSALAEHYQTVGIGIDGSPELARGLQAEADRMTALAARHQLVIEGFGAKPEAVRGMKAYAARMSALSAFYRTKGVGREGSPESIRGLQAEADRLAGLAAFIVASGVGTAPSLAPTRAPQVGEPVQDGETPTHKPDSQGALLGIADEPTDRASHWMGPNPR